MTSDVLGLGARPSLVQQLLAPGDGSLKRELARFASGLALAAIYGLGMGFPFGAHAMAAHAAGVPLAFVAVAALGAPAFYVGIAHAGLDLDARALSAAVARGSATAGMVLAGLTPALTLLSLSCESPISVACYGAAGLALGGLLGLRAYDRALAPAAESSARSLGAGLIRVAFAAFATVLAARVWWLVLPVFGGDA
jgi:hypothetical protein